MEKFDAFDPLSATRSADSDVDKVIVRGILDSYHGTYDIFAEMMQNAVDATEHEYRNRAEKHGKPDEHYIPTIWITIDLPDNSVQVCDNGTGISKEAFIKAISPGFTLKTLLSATTKSKIPRTMRFRGHKGVGLTFLAYGFNYLRISTKSREGELSGEIADGRRWVNDERSESEEGGFARPRVISAEETSLEFKEIPTGTCVTVRCDSNSTPRRLSKISQNFDEWAFILRTETAVGLVDLSSNEEWVKRAKIYLKVNQQGKIGSFKEINFSFFYPHIAPSFKFLNIMDYLKKHPGRVGVKQHHKTAYDGMFRIWNDTEVGGEFFLDKETQDTEENKEAYQNIMNTHSPMVYGFFAHSAYLWEELTTSVMGATNKKYFRDGIRIASEHMPMGRGIEPELTYTVGHKERLFLLIEFRGARPDLGRKGFTQEINSFVQRVVEGVRTYFIDNDEFLKPTGTKSRGKGKAEEEYKTDVVLDNAKKSLEEHPLEWNPPISFLTEPDCEQEVIAIFFNLLGNRVFLGYQPLAINLQTQYDCVTKYSLQKDMQGAVYSEENFLGLQSDKFGKDDFVKSFPKNLEFKMNLDGLIEDFTNEKKKFKYITFVVAWDAGQEWKKEYVLYSCLDPDFAHLRHYDGITHVLKRRDGDEEEINVILLKDLRDIINDRDKALAYQKSSYSNYE